MFVHVKYYVCEYRRALFDYFWDCQHTWETVLGQQILRRLLLAMTASLVSLVSMTPQLEECWSSTLSTLSQLEFV